MINTCIPRTFYVTLFCGKIVFSVYGMSFVQEIMVNASFRFGSGIKVK